MLNSRTPPIRWLPKDATNEIYDDGFLRVEHNNYYVECGGKHLKFGRGEFLIISLLTQKCDRYVSAEAIWNYLWNETIPVNRESLKVIIHKLRGKLKPFDIKIENMSSVGYRLVSRSKTNPKLK